ncbi:MAG: plastocyanin/azurin family copper-binding protein [Actinomycetota bacterium]|nr:plastocyanin/azurin family copper-binding protein [Actinomycetota bacterium]
MSRPEIVGKGVERVQRQRVAVAALCSLLAPLAVACQPSSSADIPVFAATESATVTLAGLEFTPADIRVEPGTVVSWKWADGAIPHNIIADGFRSETKSEGTFSHRFEQKGTFSYYCSLHPKMTGTVEVTR